MKALAATSLLLYITLCPATAQDSADVVLVVNADIITMNPQQPSARAMAFSGGRILAIGSEEEVRAAIDAYDMYYDLEGRTVAPGFIETHDHLFLASATLDIADVSPFTSPTLASALDKIQNLVPDEDGWVLAFGADQTLYEEREGPIRKYLDPLFPNVPVMIFHLSGHGAFVNQEAFRRAGIDKNTPNPEGGYFEKDAAGELTGYVSGQPALFMIGSYPPPSPDTPSRAAAMRAQEGVTMASDFSLMSPYTLSLAHEITSDPAFPVRVVGGLFVTTPGFEEIVPRLANYENDLFRIPFVKTWTDGSAQGGTGYFSEGYHNPEFGGDGSQGSQDFFNAQVKRIYELGLWPAIHANGDGAVDLALNAIEHAREATGSTDIRSQIIHSQLTRPEQITKMADLGASPTFFTTHVYYWGDLHYEQTVGPVRAHRLSAMADAFNAGIKPTMHNDPPVTPVDPIFNMWVAVNRTSSSGRVLGADQAITPHQALEAYTINAAYQFGMEDDAGSLEPGKFADFVVLDRSPLSIDHDEIRDIRVVATVRGGRTTYVSPTLYDRANPPGGN